MVSYLRIWKFFISYESRFSDNLFQSHLRKRKCWYKNSPILFRNLCQSFLDVAWILSFPFIIVPAIPWHQPQEYVVVRTLNIVSRSELECQDRHVFSSFYCKLSTLKAFRFFSSDNVNFSVDVGKNAGVINIIKFCHT